MANSQNAAPLAKVALVVVVVLALVLIMRSWLGASAAASEAYRPFVHQTFETVPPSQFVVTPFPMMINAGITAAPTAAPTVAPTVVPTYSPVPVMNQAYVPLIGPSPMNELLLGTPEATRDPVPEPVTLAPVLTEVTSGLPSATPTMVPTFMPEAANA